MVTFNEGVTYITITCDASRLEIAIKIEISQQRGGLVVSFGGGGRRLGDLLL
jgi:hypothetical protein